MTIPIIRTVIMYIFIIFAVRVMGKRHVGDLEPGELVITILISETAAIPIQETGIPLLSGIIPVIVLICLELIVSHIILKSNKANQLFKGKPVVIIRDGKLLEKEMTRVRFTIEDLMTELRQSGNFHLEQISYAIVETNGKLSILPKPEYLPTVTSDIGNTPTDSGIPVVIVSDGALSQGSLDLCSATREWVEGVLKKEKTKLSDVFLMTADKSKQYYIVKKDNA